MPSEKQIEERARKAASAVGVTPYSDMRPFVEQAVIYALTAAEQAKPAPADGGDQKIYTDPDGKVWHPHRGYWCWKVSHELAQAQKRINELEAARSGAVKPLEWGPYPYEAHAGPDVAVANISIFGDQFYQAQRDPWAHSYMAILSPKHGTTFWESKGHETLEAAKAAAQADYERRILSALEPAEPAMDAGPVVLSEKSFTGIMEWVDNPPKPTEKLKEVYQAYLDNKFKSGSTRPPESRLREALPALKAIAEGYKALGVKDRFIKVENPDFKEDDGSNPFLIIDVTALAQGADDERP